MQYSAVDREVRTAAFDWLNGQRDLHGNVLPWHALSDGFEFHGRRVPLVSRQGIFKPKEMTLPLSITTSPDSAYRDAFTPDGRLRYSYRGIDPNHRDNVGLREAMRTETPLVYLHGIAKGRYVAAWPVYVVDDNPARLCFTVEVDDKLVQGADSRFGRDRADDELAPIRRGYVTALCKRRIHQEAFRERVLTAYREQCALCKLRHEELLDAAHIVADSDPDGEPVVRNGLALCKLHHAAYDRNFLSVRPDYLIEIRKDLLDEVDGPVLRHGLQGLHLKQIQIPRRPTDRPDPALLLARHARFTLITAG